MEAINAQGKGKGNSKKAPYDVASTHYDVLAPSSSGRERVYCQARGACNGKVLTCPTQCPQRKPKKNKKVKGCFFDCSSKCDVTCKWRKPNCNGYGSLCYDRDDNLQINAHFIGTRPEGRTRDYTWVQALAVMFDTHTLVLAAKRVSKWDDGFDALTIKFDGEAVNIPTEGDAEWRTDCEEREVIVERTDETNGVKVTVAGLVELNVKVRAIGEHENKVHNYQLPADDAFAHLETQFKFTQVSPLVEGVLGKTYLPDYDSLVKRGVSMPMMGGEDKYVTPSLYSPLCQACRFKGQTGSASV
ncbi:beta-galactosidase 8-like [Hibiscus syriacus]|uniref:Beta-galactosidase 8-like n=1 Tax=Hibiscus syriacus TaxID=106335 RepID=A0A6A2XUS7_HIBSY|nr:beta-galactosidase 8-like [Hibiscus syriacus]